MTLWKQNGRWQYHYFDRDIDPSKLPTFSSLIELWQQKRGDRPAPSWSDFDFYDFEGWHGSLVIYEITHAPFNWSVRLSGTDVDTLFGRNITGHDKAKLYNLAIEVADADAFYRFTSENLLVAHTIGPVNIENRDFNELEFLELPCSDDGERANFSIEAICPILEPSG